MWLTMKIVGVISIMNVLLKYLDAVVFPDGLQL